MIAQYHTEDLVLGVNNIQVKYHNNIILNNMNLKVHNIVRDDISTPTGQIESILGPSGVGKTTLFNCLAGLQQPNQGTINLYNGHVQPVSPKSVGVVMQHYPLLEHRTVISNLIYAAKHKDNQNKGIKSITNFCSNRKLFKEMAIDMLSNFGLEHKANKYPAELSGGEKQRVAIAQQLICSGTFLLLDEPFSGLDVIAKDNVVNTLKQIAHQNEFNTILIITHDIEAAISVSYKIHIINKHPDNQGANIIQSYNLADMGIAWINNPRSNPTFYELARQIYTDFNNYSGDYNEPNTPNIQLNQ